MTVAAELSARLAGLIREVPDFPEPGVLFKDITPLLGDGPAFADLVAAWAQDHDGVEVVAGVEARGFILGAPLATRLGVGFVPVRKAGKLPGATEQASYALEYGQATLEITADAVRTGQRVLVVDDVLATGGTANATVELVEAAGGVVHGIVVLLELSFLPGRATVGDVPLTALRTV
jgi:adenine phosphoribosyltransferase